MLSQDLLDVLCCPKCHGNLKYEPNKDTLTCLKCGRVFRIENDIPIMLIPADRDEPKHTAQDEQYTQR